MEAVEEVELEEGQRLWSDPESWGGTLPGEGDDVEISSGWNMVLDLAETPVYASLTINGRLSFLDYNNTDIHLRARKIFVRAGEFFIGTAEQPFSANATITLSGPQDSPTLTLSGTVDGGNKVLGVVGRAEFYGIHRSLSARLLRTVYAGSDTIVVDAGLDWKVGD